MKRLSTNALSFCGLTCVVVVLVPPAIGLAQEDNDQKPSRTYDNRLRLISEPEPLLANYPQFVAPVKERRRFEANALVADETADLHIRAWRFSYNARGIIEMPNDLCAANTAVIMVHPWGIDDGQGWNTPEPNGVADFCTPEKNHLAASHTRTVINPLLKRLRSHVKFVMYSLPGSEDPIRKKLYRSYSSHPSEADRIEGARLLATKLKSFNYQAEPLPATLQLKSDTPVIDYFRQFPGLDAGPKYNNKGFWDLPIPVTRDVTVDPDDVVIYDAAGYGPLKAFLKQHDVRHVILTGYATDMCFCRTTAGYENLSRDFNVFLVGDATLATFPANVSPQHATNAAISFASLNQLITQVSWIRIDKSEAQTPEQ